MGSHQSVSTMVAASLLLLLSISSQLFVKAQGALILTPSAPEKAFWTKEQFMITCQNTEPLARGMHLEWLNPDMQKIEDEDAASRIHVERTDGSGLRLVNLNTTKRDGGQYRCVLVEVRPPGQPMGEAKETVVFNLRVYEAISFQGTRMTEIAQEGETFTMACHVKFDRDGLQQQSVSWLFNGQPIDPQGNSDFEVRDWDGSKSLLTVRRVNRYLEGRYKCRAVTLNTHISDIKDFVINLRVQFAPKIDREKTTSWILDPKLTDEYRGRVREDDQGNMIIPVNLTCRAEADPPARFQWKNQYGYAMKLRDEVERHSRNKPSNPAEVAEQIWLLPNESSSVMQVLFHYKPPQAAGGLMGPGGMVANPNAPPAQEEAQSPRYICQASNEMAQDQATFDIRVGEGPVTPEIHSYDYKDNMLTIRLFPLGRKIHPPIDLYRLDFSGHFVYFNETHLVNETELQGRGGSAAGPGHTVMVPGQQGVHPGQHPSQHGGGVSHGVHPGGGLAQPGLEQEPPNTGYQGKQINKKQKHPSRPLADVRLNTYQVEEVLPPGYHTVTLIAHNPIGWSQPRQAAEQLVVSGAHQLTASSTQYLSLLTSALLALVLALIAN